MDHTSDTEPPVHGSRVLQFSSDSFVDTTLSDVATKEDVYSIQSSSNPLNGLTTVLLATDGESPTEVARLTKNGFFSSDKISLNGGTPRKVKHWLKHDAFTYP